MVNPSRDHDTTVSIDSFDEAPRPRRGIPKTVKWLAGTAVGLVILAGGAGIIATQVIDQDKYKALVVQKVAESTGYTINWEGNISLGLMPLPHASIRNVTVKAEDHAILSLAKADIQVALMPLLSQKVDIRNITLDEPVVTLTTLKDGRAVWTPKSSANSAETSSDTSSETAAASPMDVVIRRVDITKGAFVIDNQQTGSKQELSNLNLALKADSLTGPFDITGDTLWSGQKIVVKATSGAVDGANGVYPIQTSISLPSAATKLEFTGVVNSKTKGASGDVVFEADDIANAVKAVTGTAPSLPDGLGGKAEVAGKLVYSSTRVALDQMAVHVGPLSYTGQMSVDGLGDGTQPQVSFSLDSKAAAPQNAAPLIGLLSDLSIAAKASLENNKLQIVSSHMTTQGNNLDISGYADIGVTPPNVDLAITASAINLDKLQNSSGSAATTDSTSASKTGKPADMGFALPVNGKIRATIGSLTTGGQTYSGIVADIENQKNSLVIHKASVNLPENASVSVSGKIAETTTLSGLDLSVAARTSDTDSLLQRYGVTPPKLSRKIGAASVDSTLTGDLKNLGFAASVSALQFTVRGEGRVADPVGTPVINTLKFGIQHPDMAQAMKTLNVGDGSAAGVSGPLTLSGQVAWADNTYNVTDITGKLGATTLSGSLSATTQPKMSLNGHLDIGAITLPSATKSGGGTGGSSGGASGGSSGSAKSSGDTWSRETIDTAWMHSFDADLKIKAKSITQNMWTLTDANLAFQLKDGVLTLDDVSAGLFGGRAAINGVIKSGTAAKDPLSLSAKLTANNVDAQRLASAAMGKMSHLLTGTLSSVDVSVNATGASPAALVQTLGGKGAMSGKNIIVQGIDAAQLADAAKGSYKPMDRAGSLFKSFQNGSTEFTDFNADFGIQNGVVMFSKIAFDGPKAALNSTGNVNLPAWTVDLKNTMTVKNTDIPAFDFTIRGPLDNPINSGDDIINTYLQKKLEAKATKLIEDKLNGKLGDKLNKFLGTGTGSGTGTGAAPAPASSADPSAAPAASTPDSTAEQPAADPNKAAAKEAVKALQGLLGR